MGLNFPAAPTVGQVHSEFGLEYEWNGEIWAVPSGTSTGFVKKAGDSMLGPLALIDPDPWAPLHSVHKRYVDQTIAANALYQGVWQVQANIPDLNVPPNAPLNGYSWIAQTADPSIPELAPATLPGIGGDSVAALDTIRWNNATQEYEQIRGATSISQMTIADAPPPTAFHGQQWYDSDSGKNYVYYVDPSGDGYWVQTSGGGGANKAEVYFGDVPPDPTFSGELWWQTTTGNMLLNYNGTWIQTNVEEAPLDNLQYTRQNAGWTVSTTTGVTQGDLDAVNQDLRADADGRYLKLAGGTLTGNVTFSGANLSVIFSGGSKIYAHSDKAMRICEDSQGRQPQIANNDGGGNRDIIDTTNGDARYLKLAGGTMTGNLTFGSDINLVMADGTSNIRGIGGNGIHYLTSGNDNHCHGFFASGVLKMHVWNQGVTVYGTFTDALEADIPGSKDGKGGTNIGKTLALMAAKIKQLEADIVKLQAGPKR